MAQSVKGERMLSAPMDNLSLVTVAIIPVMVAFMLWTFFGDEE